MTSGYTLIFIFTCCLTHFTRSQENGDVLCAINECPNDVTCLKRDGPGNITFVCECDTETSGYNCESDSRYAPYTRRETCYSRACQSGSFASPNYPQKYDPSDRILMALYIPHAEAIHFEFSSPFHIEEGKDELYVGTGLEITYDDIIYDDITQLRDGLLFFDGIEPSPNNFTLETDTAVIYFSSDTSSTFAGFKISWTATVDYTSPEITSCPRDQQFFVSRDEPWKYLDLVDPPVSDPDGREIYKDATLPEGNRFPVGSTRVHYRYADVYDNADVCEYYVHVTVDNQPPMFHGCPGDLAFNTSYPNGTIDVDWVEPNVTDNSGVILVMNSTRNPGDFFEDGTTSVEYFAADPFGNEGYCRFDVTVVGYEDEPPRSLINELIPLVICGALFTLISCVCCLGRTVKANRGSTKTSSSKSNQRPNSSSDNTRKTSSSSQLRSGAKLSVSSVFDNRGVSLSLSESGSYDTTANHSSDSSGYMTAGKSLDTIDEIGGTNL